MSREERSRMVASHIPTGEDSYEWQILISSDMWWLLRKGARRTHYNVFRIKKEKIILVLF